MLENTCHPNYYHSKMGILNIEHFFIEINLRKEKRFLSWSYNPYLILIKTHLNQLKDRLDHLSRKLDNCILLGNFNSGILNKYFKLFCESYNLKWLIKNLACFKNHDKLTCFELILINQLRSFQSSCTIDDGLADFHKFPVTVLKTYILRNKSLISICIVTIKKTRIRYFEEKLLRSYLKNYLGR